MNKELENLKQENKQLKERIIVGNYLQKKREKSI